MSSRERWTIYPLLFLALGAALRDKLTASVDTRFVTCEDLEIVDHHGQVQMRLSGHDGGSGKLLLFDDGDPRVVISSNDAGGAITAVDKEKNLFVTLGHEGTQSGVMAENQKNRAKFSARFEPQVIRRVPATPVVPETQSTKPAKEQAGPTPGWQSGSRIP